MFYARGLNTSLPIYTTRPHGRDGETASYSMSVWMTLLAGVLVWLNVVVWGLLGLYFAARVIA